LRQDPKIIHPEAVLEGFTQGAPTVRVIVSIHKDHEIHALEDLGRIPNRDRLRGAVARRLAPILRDLDSSEITVLRKFDYIPGFAAKISLAALQRLLEHPDVASVEEDRILHAHTKQGIPVMNASLVRSVEAYAGQGLSIAICDTGIDYTHPRLGGGGFPNAKVIGGYDFGGSKDRVWSQDADPMDDNGHGTSCAGIAGGDLGATGEYIGGVAHQARLYALKISHGTGGSAYESDMIAAWEWCVTHQYDDLANPIQIISTSFGTAYNRCQVSTIDKAIRENMKFGGIYQKLTGRLSWPNGDGA
jgi:subtilisin family serine protease